MTHATAAHPDAGPPLAALSAWLAQSHDLLALTDAAGRLSWANPAFTAQAGDTRDLHDLAPADWQAGAPARIVAAALRDGALADTELCLRSPSGGALWVRARVCAVDAARLWTLHDITAARALAARAQHQAELLEMVQEFGRLGIWERRIPSGEGRWDRHVFSFWGMEPSANAPDYAIAASRLHPEDKLAHIYADSIRQAGRYAQRYRVMRADGGVRWIHSQWEVKNSPGGEPDRTIGIMVDDTEVYDLARSLDATTAQLALAVDLGHIIIWRHELRTDRLHYNALGYEVLGIPPRPDGLSQQEVHSFTHPDDIAGVAAAAKQAIETGRPVDVETRYRRSDGSWRYLLTRRVLERNAAGEAAFLLGVSLDVTEQVAESRRAQQLAQRLESAARAARIGIWTTTLGTIETEWNAQMFELFDMVGEPRAPTLDEWLARCVHPDDALRIGRASRAYLRSAKGPFEASFRIVTRDGRMRWMVLRADLDRSSIDGPRVFGIAMDVTDRHESQVALHAASERAALITRGAGIGTWETDERGRHTRWDEQMFALRGLEPRERALDRDERLALVHPEDRERVATVGDITDPGTDAIAFEFRVLWPDGSVHWLASRSAALRDMHGKVVRRVGVNWDITEGKNAELARQQALLAERDSLAKSQFLSRMSHELRTPLNAVLGFTQLLQTEARRSPDAGGRLAKLNHIRSAGEHLLALINDALDLSSLEAGTLRLDLQPVPLALAVARAVAVVAELANASQIVIRSDELPGIVLADPARLHQVLLNLLSNAIKYNHPGGSVVLEAAPAPAGEPIRLGIRDTGRGMEPQQLAHLFEPFNRLGLEDEGIAGAGMGLTVARALIEGMGGRIEVTSQPGQGSRFEIALRVAPDAAADPPAASGGAPAPPGTPSTTPAPSPRLRCGQLLYIEDNPVNVLLVEEMVKSLAGLQIVCEATGSAGVARAQSLRPDMILIDMQLPDFDGFEVLRRLRAQPETAALCCIALSANALPEDIERGMAAGFDDYWTKPIRFKPFLEALERIFPIAPPGP